MKQKRKKILATLIVLLVFALVIGVGTVVVLKMNSPVEKLKRALNEKEYEVAQALYEDNRADADFKSQADNIFSDFINSSYDKYLNEELSFDDALDILKSMKFCGNEPATLISKMRKISASRADYSNAEEMVQSGDYKKAIELYQSVIKDDVANYEKVPAKIESCIAAIREQAKKDAAALLQDGKCHDAVLFLNSISKEYMDDELSETKSDAIQQLNAEADNLVKNGKFEEAVALLTDDEDKPIDSAFSAQIRTCKKEINTKKLQLLKPFVTVEYDSIEKEYTIAPKGESKVLSLSYNRPISASVSVDTDVSFALMFVFTNKDWIFTDNIIIDCGNQQFTLKADYLNSKRDVGYGFIGEVMVYLDDTTNEFSNVAGLINIRPIIEAMNQSEKITVRFKGSEGHKDMTVPSAHVEQICNLWKIYKILEEDHTLVSYLK